MKKSSCSVIIMRMSMMRFRKLDLITWHSYLFIDWWLVVISGSDLVIWKRFFKIVGISHQATRRRGDVVTMPPCLSQRRCRNVSNETPNDVSVERRQDVSVVCLHNVLLVCCDDVSWGRNDDVPSIRLHDVSNKSQMKHPKTSQWYLTKMSQWYVFTTSH